MSIIFLLSSIPGSGQPFDPPLWYWAERKGAHLFEYAVLLILAVRFFRGRFPKESKLRIYAIALVFSVAYAATDELHQAFVFGRGSMLSDVGIDAVGAGVMAVADYYGIRKFFV